MLELQDACRVIGAVDGFMKGREVVGQDLVHVGTQSRSVSDSAGAAQFKCALEVRRPLLLWPSTGLRSISSSTLLLRHWRAQLSNSLSG